MKLGPALLLVLALASSLGLALTVFADDKKPAPPSAGDDRPLASSADVEDQNGIKMVVMEPSLVRPGGGLFGGGKGQKVKELTVWNGAHQIIIALSDVTRIEVTGKVDRDFIPVKVSLHNGDVLDGKVESELELHGKVRDGQYQIKFEKVKVVTMHA